MPSIRRALLVTSAACTALLLAACNGDQHPQGMPPAAVSTIVLHPERASIVNELPGRLSATRVADVRARVPGIVLERVFSEGSEVEAGDVLFRIDPASLRAEYNNARAALARAEADAYQAAALARRYEPLVAQNAVSQQEYDTAVATDRQAKAMVESARAALESSRINLDYATVTAPISGRIGRAMVTEGALVGQGDPTPLARIQQIDTVYADFSQSAAELARLRRAFADGHIEAVDSESAEVRLVLQDGSIYPHAGRLLFSDISVDAGTGQVSLRGEFQNPDRDLLPGTYVRVRLEQASSGNALLVPQQAVQRNSGGQTFVLIAEPAVDEQGQPVLDPQGNPAKVAQQRIVRLGSGLGTNWIVEDGLEPGDELIVEGYQRAAPGAPVNAQPWRPGSDTGAPAPLESTPDAGDPATGTQAE